jgi:hypothetical protein
MRNRERERERGRERGNKRREHTHKQPTYISTKHKRVRFIRVSFLFSLTIKLKEKKRQLTMNGSWNLHSIQKGNHNTQLADRLLSIYSLFLILIGTPCNLLCCLIYFQKANRSNSIKIIFGYLACLDTIVLYTFNLNYVFRDFNVHVKIIYNNQQQQPVQAHKTDGSHFNTDNMNVIIIKKNLEEHSLFICRFLSYLGKKTTKKSREKEKAKKTDSR